MISFIGEPTADKNFEYILEGGRGIRHMVSASIEGQTVHRAESECDDPPCHEMLYIKPEFAGKTLIIRYRNSIGQSANFSFNIGFQYLER